MQYTPRTFKIPELKGISAKTIEEHLKLYAGYVKSANTINANIQELTKDAESAEKNTYTVGELQRRFGFEYDGMRNHEIYFSSFEGGAQPLSSDSPLMQAIEKQWGSFDVFLARFKSLAMTRGVGWAMMYYDTHASDTEEARLVLAWVEEQHLGHLTGLKPVLVLDMWEHSYMLDYVPSEKKKYVEAFFENLNWKVVENNFVESH